MNLFKLILIGLITLMLNACEDPDKKTITIYFITHTKSEINNLRLTDNTGYEAKVGVMRAPGNLKAMSFIPTPPGDNGKLQWTDADGTEQSQNIDLKSLNINPPGTLFLVLYDGDVETTYVARQHISTTPDEQAEINALSRKFQFGDKYKIR